MTDQLPRQIPQDPAEQERLMPEWVKVEVVRRENLTSPPAFSEEVYWPHALTIWQWMPEPVDPDLLMAREVCAEIWPGAKWLNHTENDVDVLKACLAMAKRVRDAVK